MSGYTTGAATTGIVIGSILGAVTGNIGSGGAIIVCALFCGYMAWVLSGSDEDKRKLMEQQALELRRLRADANAAPPPPNL